MLNNKNSLTGFFSAFFLAGSVVNDASPFGNDSFLTWAKIFFIIGLALALIGGLKKIKISRPELVMYLYCLILPVMSLFAGYEFSEKSLSVSISLLIGGFSFFSILRMRIKPIVLVNAYLIWISVSVILGVVQATTGQLFIGDRVFESGAIPGMYRASGLMSDPNYFSLVCLIGLALCMLPGTYRWYSYFCVLGTLLSGSRAGLLILILILVAAKTKSDLSVKFFVKLALVFVAILSFLYFFREFLPENFSMLFDAASYEDDASRNSLQDRAIAISAAIDAFMEFPLLGYGLGNLIYYPANFHNQVSHNTYVEMLAETGMAGLFMNIFVLISIFSNRSYMYRFNLQERKTPTLVLIAFLVMSASLVTYYSRILFFTLSICHVILRDKNLRVNQNE